MKDFYFQNVLKEVAGLYERHVRNLASWWKVQLASENIFYLVNIKQPTFQIDFYQGYFGGLRPNMDGKKWYFNFPPHSWLWCWALPLVMSIIQKPVKKINGTKNCSNWWKIYPHQLEGK